MNLRFLKMPQEKEPLSAPFSLSLSGERELTLAPCRRVLTYESERIRIETVGCTVEIKGEALTLSAFHENEVRVKGLILSVGVERGS
jgi:hypothetical protein